MILSEIVRITDPRIADPSFELFTSLEGDNPGGSIKDHLVEGELTELRGKGLLAEGATVSEVSAGSTALSLAKWAPRFQLKCDLFVPEGTDPERIRALESAGANVMLAPMETIYAEHEKHRAWHKTYFFNQLWDGTKERHYHSLGRRIRDERGSFPLALGAVGTGHSLKGVGHGLNAADVMTAEPLAPLRIAGIRNILEVRYGDQDPCAERDFSRRLLVGPSELFEDKKISTSRGPVLIGQSFQLVLGAYLKYKEALPRKIWLQSADSRRY